MSNFYLRGMYPYSVFKSMVASIARCSIIYRIVLECM